MVTLSETHIAPQYAAAIALFGPRGFPTPIYGEDFGPDEPGAPNAWSQSYLPPWFRWRFDYPSAAMDEPLRSNEIRRSAAHEIGHTLELACLALGIDAHRLYFEFRGFTGTWAEWLLEPWKQVREGFADCFAAALLGEWLIPAGSSQADRFFNEGKTVTATAARSFFTALIGVTLPPVTVDYAGAIWTPSPNFLAGGNTMTNIVCHWTVGTLASAIATLTKAGGFSATYIVDQRAPFIYQLVREKDRAFHDSSPGWNEKSIGIEFVHYDEDQNVPGIQQAWPSEQLEAGAALIRDIGRRRAIPLEYPRVIGHGNTYPVFTTECPGDLPIGRLIEDVLNMAEITETRLREIIREESSVPIVGAINALSKIVLNHKLRRTARWIVSKITANPIAIPALAARDPGGIGGTDSVGYSDDNTPLS